MRIFRFLFDLLAGGLYCVTVTDCRQVGGLIYCAYALKVSQRRRNLPAIYDFKNPLDIMHSTLFVRFPPQERQLIKACFAFNHAAEVQLKQRVVKKLVMGEKLVLVTVDPSDQSAKTRFEFDEKQFVGLMQRYRNKREIRAMLCQLFEIKE